MGAYVNPGNASFERIDGPNYVDKTGLIALINERVGKDNSLVCISRPRRFGKTWDAKMLMAYYDCSCDSHALFDHKKIAASRDYGTHLNKYNVICLDIAGFTSEVKKRHGSFLEVPQMIERAIWDDLIDCGFIPKEGTTLNNFLLRCMSTGCKGEEKGKPFVFIIDEWDAVIREARNDPDAQLAYLNLLRGWFKNENFTPKAVAAAYMTGILPIKKDGTQTAISEFDESSMLDTLEFAEFVGFTEEEVKERCRDGRVEFGEIKAWYDGYDLPSVGSVYNPYSVMKALRTGKCKSYWRKTSAAESLKNYINMDFEGLQETVARLISGDRVIVDVDSFQNDFESFESADDVLTLLIHLGYLTYHEAERTVQIPNEEVRLEFRQFLTQKKASSGWMTLIRRSQKILDDTIAGRADEVAAALDEIRGEQYAPQFYNNEQSLRAIIKYAYLVTAGQEIQIDEMPGGKGLADVGFIPTPLSRLPAMVVELKWNKSAGGAISQIREKKYTAKLKPFAGNILLVGINYDEKTGKHTCSIERG